MRVAGVFAFEERGRAQTINHHPDNPTIKNKNSASPKCNDAMMQ